MLNLNTIPIPRNSGLLGHEQDNFPTVGLKSILQNSDLLDLLLKPISNTKVEVKHNTNNMDNFTPEWSDLNLDELLDGPPPSKPVNTDHDYITVKNNQADSYNKDTNHRNAYLGPSLWDKDEIFQSEQFGVEYLGIDEFLSDSNLNEADIEFLDGLFSSDNQIVSAPVNNVMAPMFNAQKDERQIVNKPVTTVSSNVKTSMSTLLKEWNEDRSNEDDENSDSEDLHPQSSSKKRLFNDRLVLQPALKKSKKQFVPNEMKDEKYWARRNKNNVAAKRSRETRRLKENEIVIAATYLEHENDQMQRQLDEYKERCLLLEKRLSRYEQI